VRYEPVTAEQSSSPPGHSSNRLKLLGNNQSNDSDSDECDDEIKAMEDSISEEQHPLNPPRRLSSPILEHRTSQQNQYGGRRGSSYLLRASSGNLLAPKAGKD